jgi:hypothetical protein
MADALEEGRVSGRAADSGSSEPSALEQPPPAPECYPCPVCGGIVRERHGLFQCTRCGLVVEACCEGAPPRL